MTFKPTQYCFRVDGRIEFLCEPGCGHTIHIPEWIQKSKSEQQKNTWWSHGCDGCCDGVGELIG